jgi:phosphatidylserine/phosphatidylglycerophosphate/cardiolipin synthase-like enzyme
MLKNKIFLLLFLLCLISQAHATIYPFVTGNRLTLLEDSRQATDLTLEMVRNAQHHIHIVTFFWDDTSFPSQLAQELIKANERGVEVRILTTYFPSLATDLTGTGRRALRDLSDESKTVFSFIALKSYSNLVFFNILHEKIFLVDGKQAILGGRNISDSRFANKDMEVLIEGEAVNQVQKHFHKTYEFVVDLVLNHKCKREWSRRCRQARQEFGHTHFPENLSYFPEQPQFENGVEARILAHEVLIDQLTNDHRGTRERILIQDDIVDVVANTEFETLRGYNYFILPTPAYQNFLETRLAEGKRIELVTNSYQSASQVSNAGYVLSLPSMLDLSRRGLQVIEWQGAHPEAYLHSKIMIFDNDRVIIGAHNFGVGSTSVSNEIAIEFKSQEIAQRLIDIFESDKEESNIARPVSTEFLEQMNHQHRALIRVLQFTPIQNLLQQIY